MIRAAESDLKRRESQLWDDYARSASSLPARNALVLFYWPLVERIARRVARRLPAAAPPWEELAQEGFFGLRTAIARFDQGKGILFATFAARRVHGAMVDYLRDIDWAPRLVRLRQEDPIRMLSLETSIGSESKSGRRHVLAEAPGSCIEWRSSDADERWQELLKGCSVRERLALILYFHEDRTMRQIGRELGLSESRVSQLLTSLRSRIGRRLGAAASLVA